MEQASTSPRCMPFAARTAILVGIVLALIALPLLWEPRGSSDLLALYLAADAFGSGGAIYPVRTDLFLMHPPESWVTTADRMGWQEPIYPYIYPPLWAALLSGPAKALGFGWFEAAANLLNPILLLASSALVWRTLRPPLPLWLFLGAGQIILYATTIGGIAILQNQPQILVAFLTALAIERSRNGAPVAGGAALALAAAIKLYPALYVLIWIAAGQRRAALSFGGFGAALAGTSVLLAGWPLHREFLQLISGISQTTMILPLSFSLDARIGALVGGGQAITAMMPAGQETLIGWTSMAKGPLWSMGSRIALVAVLAATAIAAWRLDAERRHAVLWPVAMIALSLISPLGWSYHFILPALWAPLLLTWPSGRGIALCLLIFLPVSFAGLNLLAAVSSFAAFSGALGTVSMIALAAALWARSRGGPPLAPARRPGAFRNG